MYKGENIKSIISINNVIYDQEFSDFESDANDKCFRIYNCLIEKKDDHYLITYKLFNEKEKIALYKSGIAIIELNDTK